MDTNPDRLLTLDEAAAALGISKDAARKRLRRGTLTGQVVNGRWLVRLPTVLPTVPAVPQAPAELSALLLSLHALAEQQARRLEQIEQQIAQIALQIDRQAEQSNDAIRTQSEQQSGPPVPSVPGDGLDGTGDKRDRTGVLPVLSRPGQPWWRWLWPW